MGRDFPFKFPRKSKRCRHFDDDGNEKRVECDYRSADCWFAHPDDPEWEGCSKRYMEGKYPKGPAADLERYGSRRRNGAWSRSRSQSRERERDRGWGERGRQYRPRSRSPPRRRPDSLASSHASAVHEHASPGRRQGESRRASNNNINSENNNSPLTSIQSFAVPSSPALSLPPRSPAQQLQPPASPVRFFAPLQRIRPGIATTLESAATTSSSPTTTTALTVPPQPPVVIASTTTTTSPTDIHPSPPTGHFSPSPTILSLTSSTKEPLIRETMSVLSLEDGQVAESPTQPQGSGTRMSPLPPMPPLVPVPFLPSFEYEPTPRIEVSQEVKIEMWNKRIKIFAELLAYKDRIQGLEADIDDLTRYSTSSTFTSLNDDSEEKQRMGSNLEELLSNRDTAIRDIQKGLDELAIGSSSSDSTVVEWPSPLEIEEAQKKNDKVKEYVVGLADVMKEVSLTLKELEKVMDEGDDERKKRKERRRRDKGKEKEVLVDDAMDVDKEEVSTAEAVSIPSGASKSIAEGQREEREEGAATITETSSSSSSSRSLEISKIRAKFESLETSIQDVAISLEQTESSWMQGVKALFQDLVLKQKKTVRKHVGKHKQLIEQHATQLKSSLGQVSDSVNTTNVKVQNVADETSQAIEKINRLERERDSLLEGHKRFFEEELPGMKKSFREYEVQREEDRKRMNALEAALNAFINRPPGESRNMVNGATAISKMTSTMVTRVVTATSSEGVPNSNSIQTSTPTTPKLHPPTPPTSSSSLQQPFFTSSTVHPPSSSSSSNDTSYLLQIIKPNLTLLLRELVKPLLEEVRQEVEEMVSAQKEETYMNVWSSIQFTWQILGKIEKRAEVDLMDILKRASTAAPTAAERVGMGGGENVGGKGKEKEGESGVNGDVSMDVDPNVNASSTAARAPSASAMGGYGNSLTNGNGTVVPTASPGVAGQ